MPTQLLECVVKVTRPQVSEDAVYTISPIKYERKLGEFIFLVIYKVNSSFNLSKINQSINQSIPVFLDDTLRSNKALVILSFNPQPRQYNGSAIWVTNIFFFV